MPPGSGTIGMGRYSFLYTGFTLFFAPDLVSNGLKSPITGAVPTAPGSFASVLTAFTSSYIERDGESEGRRGEGRGRSGGSDAEGEGEKKERGRKEKTKERIRRWRIKERRSLQDSYT